MFLLSEAMFVVYVRSEKQIDRANELRLQSYLLIDELRQSADDLANMARSYVATGQAAHKDDFAEILAIRDGKQVRPQSYHDVYWDLVLADGRRPRPASGQTAALIDLMRAAEFTDQELAKLIEAKHHADRLADIERAAMELADSDRENLTAANLQLQSQAYLQARSQFMHPISEAYQMMATRTFQTVRENERVAFYLRGVFLALGMALLWSISRVYAAIQATLGAPVDQLHAYIAELGSADIGALKPVAKAPDNSVMAWLSETQARLVRADGERRQAEAKNQRLTRFYAALSQCNQAIVRCSSETELFPEICRDAVVFGGMKMAWIGILNPQTQLIEPVACYGSGTEYLDGLEVSADEQRATGRGPTGTAVRENRAFWCQDFQNEPVTSFWRQRAMAFEWKASASLPLHRNGRTIGAFTLYASETHAFDEPAQNLLIEMAMDIDYALNSFEREKERQRAQQMESFRLFMLEKLNGGLPLVTILEDVTKKFETYFANSLCSVLLLDEDGEHVHIGAAPSLPEFYNQAIEGARIGPGFGSCGNTAYTGQRTIVEDIAHHPYWDAYRPLAERAGLRACWSEPILASGKKVLGTFAVYQRQPAAPDEHALHLLEMVGHFVAVAIERKQAEEHIYYLANYDPLTGLPNRNQLNDHMKFAISFAKRSNGQLALMFLDLDHFKDINDTLGHSIGDALLVELASRLRSVLRDEDTVTRMGGDEFIFVLPGTHAQGAAYVAQKLLDTIAQPYRIENYELTLTASIGIALYPDDGNDLETLSKSADTAMYRAKLEGRHGSRFFAPEMHARSARNLQLVTALRHALDRNQFYVHYQPQVTIQGSRVIGAEALLRWRHPELGLVSPAEFIPVAEDSGLILQIGEWVLRSAVRQAAAWLRQGYEPLIMAVNLSAVQFNDPSLPELVARVLAEEALPAEYLELELTEGVAMRNPQAAIAMMDNLHQLGVLMSIDDFGTGYSSLNYLKKFKVYKLKIDQSFIRDVTSDSEDKAIVNAVISLARSLGLRTIAEGVERAEQLNFLSEQGCDEMQGYYFGKPVAAGEFVAFLSPNSAG